MGIDFGLSRYESTNEGGVMNSVVGTPHFIAPEVLRGSYTKSCDMWSIGIITYILLCGYMPFYGNTARQIFNSILLGNLNFPSPEWDLISKSAKQFISNLLGKDHSKRMNATEALDHTWIKDSIMTDRKKLPKLAGGSSDIFKLYREMDKSKKSAFWEQLRLLHFDKKTEDVFSNIF